MHATVEFEASKARIEALEGEKRELVAAFDRKVGELEEMNKDYQAMSTRYQELRKESSKLESEAREAKAADMSRKVCPQFLWILVRNLCRGCLVIYNADYVCLHTLASYAISGAGIGIAEAARRVG